MEFSEKLICLRKEKGWSQEELGNQLSVTRQTVSKWELGQTTPEMNKLIEISALFNISLDELLNTAYSNSKKENIQYKSYFSRRLEYEYKSKKELFGMPLVHINIGIGMRKAKGIVAIGNIATGLLSIGFLAMGLLPIGFLALGLLAIGMLPIGGIALGAIAIGIIAAGGIAVGVLALGGLAIGIYSIGGMAIARDIAMGGHASGHIAIGNTTKGAIKFITESNFNNIDFTEVRIAILREFPDVWKVILRLFS